MSIDVFWWWPKIRSRGVQCLAVNVVDGLDNIFDHRVTVDL